MEASLLDEVRYRLRDLGEDFAEIASTVYLMVWELFLAMAAGLTLFSLGYLLAHQLCPLLTHVSWAWMKNEETMAFIFGLGLIQIWDTLRPKKVPPCTRCKNSTR